LSELFSDDEDLDLSLVESVEKWQEQSYTGVIHFWNPATGRLESKNLEEYRVTGLVLLRGTEKPPLLLPETSGMKNAILITGGKR
jgi:hypothetical protein